MPPDIDKADLYRSLGFGGDTAPYDRLLAEAGLTNPRKTRISTDKADAVRRILEAGFIPVCQRGDCQAAARSLGDHRQPVPAADQSSCAVCGGSINAAAVDEMVAAARRVGWSKLCVVGGSPNLRDEFERLVAGRVQLRLIPGTATRNRRQAAADLAWADRIVLWGSTPLDHKVSQLYTGKSVVQFNRRSISELAKAITLSAATHG
jgi:hypothetical protein